MGYSKPYEWAHLFEVPFRALNKPLSQASVAVITFQPQLNQTKVIKGRVRPWIRPRPFTRFIPRQAMAHQSWAYRTCITTGLKCARRTRVQFPERWGDNPDWKLDFFNVPHMSDAEFERVREDELAWRKPPG